MEQEKNNYGLAEMATVVPAHGLQGKRRIRLAFDDGTG
jgi:hypothetical protein